MPGPATARQGAGERPRRTWPKVLVAVAGVTLVAVALYLALVDSDDVFDLSGDEAFALPAQEAAPLLDEARQADDARRADLLAQPGFLVQLSGKCALNTQGDIFGLGGPGLPDGIEEAYPNGVGENGILAFHLGARDRWGETVLLARGDDIGRAPCPDGRPVWLTFDALPDAPFATVGDALCECRTRGLPFGECGATPTDGSPPTFWSQGSLTLACT